MPYSVTGHYVQVWKPSYESRFDVEWVDVGKLTGDHWTRKITRQEQHAGWYGVKNALNKRDAIKLARGLRGHGFHSRVMFKDNAGNRTQVKEFKPKGQK